MTPVNPGLSGLCPRQPDYVSLKFPYITETNNYYYVVVHAWYSKNDAVAL